MANISKEQAPGGPVLLFVILVNAIVLKEGLVQSSEWYAILPVTSLLLLAALIVFHSKPLP